MSYRRTKMFMRSLVATVLVLVCCIEFSAKATAAPYRARGGNAITRDNTGWQRVQKGVWEISHEQLLLVRYFSNQDAFGASTSRTSANFIGGITPRYFIIDNLALGVSVNAFLGINQNTASVGGQTVTAENKDIGLLAFAMANYYVRLSNGMFFAPGVGIGGFYGQRFTPDPVDAGRAIQTVLVGGAGRLDLGFVFYASRRVNLKAGLDVLFRFGNERFADAEPAPFSSVDAGFHVGIGVVF